MNQPYYESTLGTGGIRRKIYLIIHLGKPVLAKITPILSAIERAPTHQDTIEQGVFRTVLSAYKLLRAEITGSDMI